MSDLCWLVILAIAVNFGLENLASLSLAVNLIIYFMTVMHIGLTDGSNLLTNYMGTSYMVAVLISVFADTFIGRYKTVIISSVIELVVRIFTIICMIQFFATILQLNYCSNWNKL